MVARKIAAARHAAKPMTKIETPQIIMLIASFVGLVPLAVLTLLALIVVIAILGFSGASVSSHLPDPSSSAGQGSSDFVTELAGGSGRGAFAEANVPDRSLVEPIKDAAKECDLLTPVILAAQIEYASNFDPKKEGPGGRKGLSQLEPDVFTRFGKDDDDSGEISALDPEDSIYAHARYFCHLADETKRLLDDGLVVGDHLTLTLMAWEMGLETVKAQGGMPFLVLDSYPFLVRALFAKYTDAGADTSTSGSAAPATSGSATPEDPDGGGTSLLSKAQFEEMFPNRNPFYTYAGLTEAMAKFPAFAGTGDETTRRQELAAFLANIDHETQGFVYIEETLESRRSNNYCDGTQSYGCPAGRDAYYGRGPIQLSWNTNYKVAGDAIRIDLLNNPDLVKTDPSVAWQTAVWFWMTQNGPGRMPAHSAITGEAGFGETIRSINGAKECGGGNPAQVQSRVSAYKRFAAALGVDPGDESKLTC
jgi:predicted chitinase/type II secretory pathway pseudopilin PulG